MATNYNSLRKEAIELGYIKPFRYNKISDLFKVISTYYLNYDEDRLSPVMLPPVLKEKMKKISRDDIVVGLNARIWVLRVQILTLLNYLDLDLKNVIQQAGLSDQVTREDFYTSKFNNYHALIILHYIYQKYKPGYLTIFDGLGQEDYQNIRHKLQEKRINETRIDDDVTSRMREQLLNVREHAQGVNVSSLGQFSNSRRSSYNDSVTSLGQFTDRGDVESLGQFSAPRFVVYNKNEIIKGVFDIYIQDKTTGYVVSIVRFIGNTNNITIYWQSPEFKQRYQQYLDDVIRVARDYVNNNKLFLL